MEWDEEDHYRALGLAPTATTEQVREAYQKKVQSRFHPDNGGDPFGWSRYQRAYNTLIDMNSRARYDAQWWVADEDDGEEEEDADSTEAIDDPWEVELEEFDLHAALGVSASGSDGDAISGGESRVLSRFYDVATLTWPAAAAAGSTHEGGEYGDEEGEEGKEEGKEEGEEEGEEEGKEEGEEEGEGGRAKAGVSGRSEHDAREGGVTDNESDADDAGTVSAAERPPLYGEAARAAVLRFRRACLAFSVLRDPERRRVYAACGYSGLVRSEAYQADSVFDSDARTVREQFFRGDDPAVREFLLLRADDREVEGEGEGEGEGEQWEAAVDKAHADGGGGDGGGDGGGGGRRSGAKRARVDVEEGGNVVGDGSEEEEEDDEEAGVGLSGFGRDFADAAQLAAKLAALRELPPPPPPPELLSASDSLAELLPRILQQDEDAGEQQQQLQQLRRRAEEAGDTEHAAREAATAQREARRKLNAAIAKAMKPAAHGGARSGKRALRPVAPWWRRLLARRFGR